MKKFTKARVLYFVTAIIFILIEIFILKFKVKENPIENIMEENITIEKTEILQNNNEQKEESQNNEIWQLEIPKIALVANIKEGTTKEILNEYIGHFSETQKESGNIGLAGHNRGYKVNYFQDLKLLKKGDEIKYRYNGKEKEYVVEKCRIIKDTEWEYLENTEDNRLTLITCVENQPEYRRCIQAIEKEEEIY